MSEKRKVGRREQRRQGQAQEKQRRLVRLAGLTVLLLAVVLAAVFWRRSSDRAAAEAVERPPAYQIGPADAPVHIVEFGDFGCHACRDWHQRGIKQQLIDTYGEQIRFEFRHFPVITRQSPRAAEAGQCAAAQHGFWLYHDYIYEQAPEGALAENDLVRYATAAGLDEAAFTACLESGRYRDSVRLDLEAAQDAGARGTPTFFVNGRQVFPTYNGLSEAIEAALGR